MTHSLTDQLGMIEAERDRLKAENETLKVSRSSQKAVIEEYRGTVDRLERMIAAQAELIGTYKNHFRTLHGSADSIIKQERAIAAAAAKREEQADTVLTPDAVETIKSRIARIIGRDDKAINGATNGHAAA